MCAKHTPRSACRGLFYHSRTYAGCVRRPRCDVRNIKDRGPAGSIKLYRCDSGVHHPDGGERVIFRVLSAIFSGTFAIPTILVAGNDSAARRWCFGMPLEEYRVSRRNIQPNDRTANDSAIDRFNCGHVGRVNRFVNKHVRQCRKPRSVSLSRYHHGLVERSGIIRRKWLSPEFALLPE